ncbi:MULTISPECIES: phosphoenolpyruvate carboxykinase [Marichromatium]|uniref:Phosphoenolpyruvate carboxykinase (ATP) n=1 Tax=Marichromatium gracile TaxID=1048 RepID=A0A4R4AG09_MARGR|nr:MULTISPECIES: phosphoenolpyruvate carboxykinase [Marichromatium]MBK1710151.1 phosphoenolpyruvate carboxykinase (ATP) [Marichromatium gracile]RNE89134.1 phosphoenolpyruvate carboxykinase [Marichromatium sp. AB31]RNE92401.1 phosphoenolpyruvate carboxykinase [Marichromatium sp. AB32]TCW38123.1 phosphoenolpyruvate carboxykinase (ATP) [Marichromatium gracile]
MRVSGRPNSDHPLEQHGLYNLNAVHWNLPTAELYEQALARYEGQVAHMGPLVVRTGHHTGRSANDKFIVEEAGSRDDIWWGDVNRPIDIEHFDLVHHRLASYLQMKDVYVQDCFVGADPNYRLPARVITEKAWHSLFARNLFIQPKPEELEHFAPEFTVIAAPHFHSIPGLDKTNSETCILVNFEKRLVLIGGTSYAGEIKKSLFTVMNHLMPGRGVLPMHCSANIGEDGRTALFFGLSGTGKTTLSADASRTLIGDDEHGWSDEGVFNFEGGCYAKMIRLSADAEPEIHATTRRFGTVLENVTMDMETRRLDLDDDSLTENTRGAYHISAIPNASETGMGGHPDAILFLTCDAFGVLPPISRLTPEQAMYHFISGYTARVAGTEKGVTEPSPVFSACYGAPFMPRHPQRYAELLGKRLAEHGTQVWLINTGWSGGPYGVGKRVAIPHTRAMVHAVLDRKLEGVATRPDPIFGLNIPESCPGVPTEILDPRATWSDPAAYDAQARKLAGMFRDNFTKFTDEVDAAILAAGPQAG